MKMLNFSFCFNNNKKSFFKMNACMSAPSGGHPLTVCCHTSSGAASEASDCSLGLQRLNQHDPIKRACSRAGYSEFGPWTGTAGNLDPLRNVDSQVPQVFRIRP